MDPLKQLRRIRIWLIIFVIGLVLSGVTAFPLLTEIRLISELPVPGFAVPWLDRVRAGLEATGRDYPFLFYGTDWLAFAHIVIGLAFIGPYRDPVRNIWVVQWAMLCCVAVVPLALIAGPIRGIPWWWQLADISFGVFGIIPLWIVYRHIKALSSGGELASRG
ncbi:MAG TPA: hypothetical protein VF062_12205 [Candidatus Limnocylindrales bacterium]